MVENKLRGRCVVCPSMTRQGNVYSLKKKGLIFSFCLVCFSGFQVKDALSPSFQPEDHNGNESL